MSPATKRNFRARAPVMPQTPQEGRSPLLRRPAPKGDLRLRVSDRLGTQHRNDLLDPGVAGGLGEDLLAEEARGSRQEDAEPGPPAERGQGLARLVLEAADAVPDLPLGKMRGLPEPEVDVLLDHAHELLREPAHGPGARGRAEGLAHPRAEGVRGAHPRAHSLLVARETDQPPGHELDGDLDGVLVAVSVDEELVGPDGLPDLLPAGHPDASDVARGRDVGGRRGGLRRRGHGPLDSSTRAPGPAVV